MEKKNRYMKKCLVMLSLVLTVTAQAQLIQENEMAIVYYMPQNELCIDVDYVQIERKAGMFMDYARQYLGATDIIEADETTYQLGKVSFSTRTRADLSRAYKVVAENGVETQLLSLTRKGLLYGYNVEEDKPSKPDTPPTPDKPHVKTKTPAVLPLFEEQIANKTLEEIAEGAAKQIYRIRETRIYILGGEVEHAPADGKALQRVLDELDKQEQQLTELFVGKETITKKRKTFHYTPLKSEAVEIALFSENGGFVQENGYPLVLHINANRQMKAANTNIPNKKDPTPSQIYYNVPGTAEVSISYQEEVKAERILPIAQLGVSVPLAKELFTGKVLPHIYFDTVTGNIQSITK